MVLLRILWRQEKNYEIRLSGDDALTISLLENAGNASLAVKVRDQMYAQRDAFLANLSKQARPNPEKPMTDAQAVDYLREIFGGAR